MPFLAITGFGHWAAYDLRPCAIPEYPENDARAALGDVC
jgi:hypothetical protein